MSGKISGMVWDLALEPHEKYVLLCYADHADHRGHNVRPGMELIAHKTGYKIRNIQKIVRHLEELGYLVPVKYTKGGRGKVTEYRIDFTHAQWSDDAAKDVLRCTVSPKGALQCTLSENGAPEDTVSDTNGALKGALKGAPQCTPILEPLNQPPLSEGGGARAHEAVTAELLPTQHPGGQTKPPADFWPTPALWTEAARLAPALDLESTTRRFLLIPFKAVLDWGERWLRFILEEHEKLATAARASPLTRAEQRAAANAQSTKDMEDIALGRNTRRSVWDPVGDFKQRLSHQPGPGGESRLPPGARGSLV